MKKIFVSIMFSLLIFPAFAYEDCIITTNGKLTDIKIQDNTMVDVYPLITIMNDKNTLFVQPLKEGRTKFCVLKNGKEITMFDIEILPEKTIIEEVEGYEILTLDSPPEGEGFVLDLPPVRLGN